MQKRKSLELYIHIPFCVRKCAYCDFLSFPAPDRVMRQYTDQLLNEMRGQRKNFAPYLVDTVFIGGGTPSLLPPDQIEAILQAVRGCFSVNKSAEITLEANPGTLTPYKLRICLANGVNRLSLGLQSADAAELAYLGRIHTYEDFLKSYQLARQAGFENINVDLMSALPGQTPAVWKNTLRRVMMFRPEHISAYSLMIEEGTSFWQRYGAKAGQEPAARPEDISPGAGSADGPSGRAASGLKDLPALPDEETERLIDEVTREMMAAYGYRRYEISNYAKPGYACHHNIGYWTGAEYLGLGLGASSFTHGYRYKNTADLEEYLSLDLSRGGEAAREITHLSPEEQMEEFMILGLRMTEGVSGGAFADRFGRNMWQVYGEVFTRLEAMGLIEAVPPQVRLSPRGIEVSNQVLCEFLLD